LRREKEGNREDRMGEVVEKKCEKIIVGNGKKKVKELKSELKKK